MPDARGNWEERWEAIRKILAEREVGSQAALQKELRKRGFRVTQSSVSRDLAEMGVAKVEGRYVDPEALAVEPPPPGLVDLAGFLLGWSAAGPYLLVVKSTPGAASSVALAVDRAGWPEVVGTVAGDDALFVATAGRNHQARVEARLRDLAREISRG